MTDLLLTIYPWVKSLHVIAVISWMAGMFYLPRLFVYHEERVKTGTDTDDLFKTMEYRLLKIIINPAMTATWIFGLIMVFTPGIIDWSAIWPYTKAAAVLAMSAFHGWLVTRQKEFAEGQNRFTGRQYRIANEVPTVLMVIIVISIIARPF